MSDWNISTPFGKLDKWPKTADGTPVPPAFLEYLTGMESEVELTLNLLEAYSIPVFCTYPNNGDFGKTILGFSGTGTMLYVPETLLEDARNILSADVENFEEEEK